MTIENLALFALNATRDFGERVAAKLAVPLTEHEEREFEDGEHKARPLVSIRAKDAYIIQSLYSDDRQSVNDKLCRLLFFAGAVRDGRDPLPRLRPQRAQNATARPGDDTLCGFID